MTKAEIYSKILDVSEKSYYRWKSKDHTVLIKLIEKHFSDSDLEEFLQTGKIKKFEEIEDLELLNNEAVNIYTSFVLKLDPGSLSLFLTVTHTSNINNQDINSNFIELIFDTDAQKKDKINLIKEFQKIQNTTIFFYAIKFLIKNKFEKFFVNSKDNILGSKETLLLGILHIQWYISIFLKKVYIEMDKFKEEETKKRKDLYLNNFINGFSFEDAPSAFDYSSSEDILEIIYFDYLLSLVFEKKSISTEEGFEC